ncbi:hypothetical protein H6G17_03005 [Chroococcidiopsis sp. FACHB-1243]|uniref:hypothetical protein n=1 Tax=Chroococcidiopsis sp. [FACHB-1243] TaxID=2692781 RepID=UPI001785F0E0|nr:hypothetical protein [Chroococcidiopsis sp. [FACHB-1243]]MBD2304487.1 hypothetical protein [Chroococcidiopsis sp. [FACHB-1243]]
MKGGHEAVNRQLHNYQLPITDSPVRAGLADSLTIPADNFWSKPAPTTLDSPVRAGLADSLTIPADNFWSKPAPTTPNSPTPHWD